MKNNISAKKKLTKEKKINKVKDVVTLINDTVEYKIYLPNATTDYIQKKISTEKQPYELDMLQNIQGWLKSDDLMLDIGANIGNHTLYIAATVGCSVVAFEPNTNLVEALQSSIVLNDFKKKVTVHSLGLGNKKTKGHFSREIPDNLGGQDIALGAGDIQVVPLDSIDFSQSVKLLKIDVEGMELSVLQGGEGLLRKDRPLVYVECLTETEFQKVANFLDKLNYCYWDTFNASPTHLFRPNEQVDLDHRVSRLQLKSVQDTYKSEIQLTDTLTKLNNANKKYRESEERITSLKKMLAQETIERGAESKKFDNLQAKLIEATQALHQEQEMYLVSKKDLGEKINNQNEARHELEKEQIRLSQHAMLLQQQLDEANKKYRESEERITSLKETLAKEAAERSATSKNLDNLQTKLIEATQALHQEQEVYLVSKKELGEKINNQNEARHELEKEQIRLSQHAMLLQQQLDEANKKYRESEERVASLKETAERSGASKKLDNLQTKLIEATQILHQEREVYLVSKKELGEKINNQNEVRHEFEKEQIRLSQHAMLLQQQLDEANRKYRETEECITSLKETLAQETAELRAASNKLDNLQEKLIEATQVKHQKRDVYLTTKKELGEKISDQNEARYELEKEQIRLSQHAMLLQQQLDEANRKYRESEERIISLKEILAKKITEHIASSTEFEKEQIRATDSIEQLKLSLHDANQKYREVTSSQVPVLKSINNELSDKIEKLTADRLAIEQRLIKTRASLTYQLGYQIRNGITSVRGFIRLPLALWRIYRQALKRRKLLKQKDKQLNKNVTSKASIPQVKRSSQQPAPKLLSDVAQARALQTKGSANELKIACIMDEFTYGSFAPECNLQQLTPADWKKELETFKPEMLFVESAWRGKDELWGSKVGHKSAELQGIVQWCREHSIPTVFWNKEDPVHFQTFLSSAKLFDRVFTTDLDCIHRYKAALGHNRVYFLPFACQPATHNPIELYERKDAISFAGAYYVRYPERTKDLESYIDALPVFKPVEIYDRNYGKDDSNYQFPEKYQSFIVGTLPFDKIDQAYKGYQYAINLNSIKQSQTMFARRIYELLASNTITISNFSRGLRLLMGDLVITSDNGGQVVQRMQAMEADTDTAGKFKLAALRKVMLEHTYQQRLKYICSKIDGFTKPIASPPELIVLARAVNQTETDQLIEQFQLQSYENKRLILEVPAKVKYIESENIDYLQKKQSKAKLIKDVVGDALWIASMSAEDYYGPNYLLDIIVASQYSDADLVGKAAHFQAKADSVELLQADKLYRPVQVLPVRQAAIKVNATVLAEKLKTWLEKLSIRDYESENGLAIDPYNYCRKVKNVALKTIKDRVDDLQVLDNGLSIDYLQSMAENIAPAENTTEERMLDPIQLAELFGDCKSKKISLISTQEEIILNSRLGDGQHEYLYAAQDIKPEELAQNRLLKCYLDCTPGLAVSLVILFLDAQKQRINHVIFQANHNATSEIPPEAEWLRLGLRVLSGGESEIKGLVLGHRDLQPAEVLGKADHLIVTNHYPSYHDLYRNGFVHSRVKAYAEKGVEADVFRLRVNEQLSFDEFEGVDVLTGDSQALETMLASSRYKSVLVHFLDPDMWSVIKNYIDKIKVIVWIHGAEIQPLHRREYNYKTDEERALAKIQSDHRMNFWRGILKFMPKNLRLVFVSKYFSEEVMSDIEIELPEEQVEIIHNPIDTEMFDFQEKPVEQRKKILSIRPFASAKYANDLSVEAIHILSKKPWFNELEFRLIGDGVLFDETLESIRHFDNVVIERGFLKHDQIAELHKEYGIFLCPTRMDAQGVSRDEAMSSGLVPVTNGVTAIPEFVDESFGILAPGEDAQAMADGIIDLYENPEKFQAMSAAAAKRVRNQSGHSKIVIEELLMINKNIDYLG